MAQCPGALPVPPFARWIWSPLYFEDTTSMPVQAAPIAATGWNNIQSNIRLNPSGPFSDIFMLDDNTMGDVSGRTTLFNQTFGPCPFFLDTCGRCMSDSVMYRAVVRINADLLRFVAMSFGYDLTVVAANTIGHEFGHALSGLTEVDRVVGDPCQSIQSIMYDCGICRLQCNVISPQVPCDSNGILAAYPFPLPDITCFCSGTFC